MLTQLSRASSSRLHTVFTHRSVGFPSLSRSYSNVNKLRAKLEAKPVPVGQPEAVLFEVNKKSKFLLGTAFVTTNAVAWMASIDLFQMLAPERTLLVPGMAVLLSALPFLARYVYGNHYITSVKLHPGWDKLEFTSYGIFCGTNKTILTHDQISKFTLQERENQWLFQLTTSWIYYTVEKTGSTTFNAPLLRQVLNGKKPSQDLFMANQPKKTTPTEK